MPHCIKKFYAKMKHKRKIRAFLKRADERDNRYHPISCQVECGVRHLSPDAIFCGIEGQNTIGSMSIIFPSIT